MPRLSPKARTRAMNPRVAPCMTANGSRRFSERSRRVRPTHQPSAAALSTTPNRIDASSPVLMWKKTTRRRSSRELAERVADQLHADDGAEHGRDRRVVGDHPGLLRAHAGHGVARLLAVDAHTPDRTLIFSSAAAPLSVE